MKKIIITVLGIAMVLGLMTGCGKTAENASAPATDTQENASGAETKDCTYYTCDDYSICYDNFELNEVRGMIQLSYNKADVQAPGSNQILITVDEGMSAEELANTIAGDEADKVSDGILGSQEIPVKIFSRTSDSPAEGDNLTLVDSFMVMQSGDKAITLEIIRTIGQDDETDMTVEGSFTHSIESFVLN